MISLVELAELAKTLPEEEVIKAVNGGSSTLPPYLALSEMSRRKSANDMFKGLAAANKPQTTVVQDMMGAQQPQPMSQPAQQPVQMAQAQQPVPPVQGFASGGPIPDYIGDATRRRLERYYRPSMSPSEYSNLLDAGSAKEPYNAGGRDYFDPSVYAPRVRPITNFADIPKATASRMVAGSGVAENGVVGAPVNKLKLLPDGVNAYVRNMSPISIERAAMEKVIPTVIPTGNALSAARNAARLLADAPDKDKSSSVDDDILNFFNSGSHASGPQPPSGSSAAPVSDPLLGAPVSKPSSDGAGPGTSSAPVAAGSAPVIAGGAPGFSDEMIATQQIAKASATDSDPMGLDGLSGMLAKSYGSLDSDLEDARLNAQLMAGLAIMGGTSPFAMENIGKGAQAGLGMFMQNKQAIEDKRGDLENRTMDLAFRAEDNAFRERQFAYEQEMNAQRMELARQELAMSVARAGEAAKSDPMLGLAIKALEAKYKSLLDNPLATEEDKQRAFNNLMGEVDSILHPVNVSELEDEPEQPAFKYTQGAISALDELIKNKTSPR